MLNYQGVDVIDYKLSNHRGALPNGPPFGTVTLLKWDPSAGCQNEELV